MKIKRPPSNEHWFEVKERGTDGIWSHVGEVVKIEDDEKGVYLLCQEGLDPGGHGQQRMFAVNLRSGRRSTFWDFKYQLLEAELNVK